ncbi:MAG: hypothetical protein ACJ8H8_20550, partial [Geminicoccaceae bacterium]
RAASYAATEDPKTADAEPPKTDEDIQRDLQALFAIRDAAMADTARRRPEEDEGDTPNDFQPTQPFSDSGGDPKK